MNGKSFQKEIFFNNLKDSYVLKLLQINIDVAIYIDKIY